MDAQQLQTEGFSKDAADGVWLAKGVQAPAFAYSDGDVESWIYKQLGIVQDLSTGSPELNAMEPRDWPTTYHFSAQRANLLRPLAHAFAGRQVLEVGAGCGAITRYLGEVGAQVTAVEGSMRRANIARRRCRDLPNVEVICANSMDLAWPGQFDVVTLVGVLEYSRQFVQAADPIQAMLSHCRSFLKPGGLLVLAIENKLGLKYFAGAYEDHVGKSFYGLQGSYRANEPVTFGRKELAGELVRAGYAGQRFYYPFPDYKLPSVVLTQEGALASEPVVHNLCNIFVAQDQGRPYARTFSEQAVWPQLMANGLLPDLANSFLVVAREGAFTATDEVLHHPGDLAYIYSTQRPRQFRKENTMRRLQGGEAPGHIEVLRNRLYPTLEPRRGRLVQHVHNEQATMGPSMLQELTDILNRPGWSLAHVARWAEPWTQMLAQLQAQQGSTQHNMPHVPGHFVDLAPQNLIHDPGQKKWIPIDLEWDLGQPIPAHYVIFRGLLHTLNSFKTVAPPAAGTPLHVITAVQEVLAHLSWGLNEAECFSLTELEAITFGGSQEELWQLRLQTRS